MTENSRRRRGAETAGSPVGEGGGQKVRGGEKEGPGMESQRLGTNKGGVCFIKGEFAFRAT